MPITLTPMIPRPLYTSQITPFIDKPFVKVLTGMRRSGKSVVLKLIAEELERRGVSNERIVYMNFESFEWMDIADAKDLYLYVKQRVEAAGTRVYILLDEVQEVAGWERAVNSFMVDWDVDVYITGSNSRLLSSELATYLTGRYVSFNILPLSFGEYLTFHGLDGCSGETLRDEFMKYLRMGGFPAVHLSEHSYDDVYKLVYDIYSSAVLRDVVQRHNIRNVELLEKVLKFVFDNLGNRLNANNIANYFKSQHRRVDVNTIYNYLDALESSFIIRRVRRYDVMGREQLQTNEKYFVSDLSLVYSVMGYADRMISGALENIVYLELLRRGYSVYIGRQGEREVDFVGIRRDEKVYVQVAYRLDAPSTIDREFAPLLAIDDRFPKFVVSTDADWHGGFEGIEHRNITEFLTSVDW